MGVIQQLAFALVLFICTVFMMLALIRSLWMDDEEKQGKRFFDFEDDDR